MMQVRKSYDRGHANHGWLDTYHSFSFADYYDPKNMGFSVLRVINEDKIAKGAGFGMHGHRDMEIITYLVEGAIEHQDSMGNGEVVRPGEIQRMSAGRGVFHSEYNPSQAEGTHLLQIWITPDREGYVPSYEQKKITEMLGDRGFGLVASRTGRDDSVSLNQDVDLYVGKSAEALNLVHTVRPGRNTWIQVVKGDVEVNGQTLNPGDGAGLKDVSEVKISTSAGVEFLLFDLP